MVTERTKNQNQKSRVRIKAVALKLFATRGMADVSTREIAQVCGLRNAGSVNYHFGTKQELVAELVRDASALIERDRNTQLDYLESLGRPRSVREVVAILSDMSIFAKSGSTNAEYGMRLLNMLYLQDRPLLFSTLGGGADSGTRRCLAHLRAMLSHVPASILRLRMMLAIQYLFAATSTREAAVEAPEAWSALWGEPYAWSNYLDTVEGMLSCPVSQLTQQELEKAAAAFTGGTATS
ncbi:helix-turn-helix domain-containing protein [Chelatococcus reniformis]|uniref:TetR family transcriptional regulator n=1 Tax=Chelatococcus reniformis TaxID=1494448 RepID=A0A916XKP4_9HYPH|nr:helix-turn-helix domain-containing protein [Chelatococcus reniformis]GGC77839.1 TetR family transcriptional regulator [Chelatococcus reniformis]